MGSTRDSFIRTTRSLPNGDVPLARKAVSFKLPGKASPHVHRLAQQMVAAQDALAERVIERFVVDPTKHKIRLLVDARDCRMGISIDDVIVGYIVSQFKDGKFKTEFVLRSTADQA